MKVENKTKKTVTSALFYVLYVALAVLHCFCPRVPILLYWNVSSTVSTVFC